MGPRLSSNNDFNHALINQPRKSIDMKKFELPSISQSQSFGDSLRIPTVVNNLQSKSDDRYAVSTLQKEPSIITEHVKPIAPKPQLNSNQSIETTLFSGINDQIQKEPKQDQPLQKPIELNSSCVTQSDIPKHHPTVNDTAVVVSRSVNSVKDERYSRKHHSSSFQPYSTVVEQNGKQYLIEFKERVEVRYVQLTDETTHQTRSFEVIDYIPYRIIRPYQYKSPIATQNNTSQNTLPPKLRSSQHSIASLKLSEQSENATPLTHIYNKNLIKHSNSPRNDLLNELPSVNYPSEQLKFIPTKSSSIGSQTSIRSTDDTYSSTAHSNKSSVEEADAEEIENINQILRAVEDHKGYTQTNPSVIYHQNNTAVSYEIIHRHSSSVPLDPFVRLVNSNDRHHYRKPSNMYSNAEPIPNNQKFQQPINPDYAPIPTTTEKSNQNHYSAL